MAMRMVRTVTSTETADPGRRRALAQTPPFFKAWVKDLNTKRVASGTSRQ